MSGEPHKILIVIVPNPNGPEVTHALNATALGKAIEDLRAQAALLGYKLNARGEIDPLQPEDPARIGRIKALADEKMAPKPLPAADENQAGVVVGVRRGESIEEEWTDEKGRSYRRKVTHPTTYGVAVDAHTKGLSKALGELMTTPVELAISAVVSIARVIGRARRPPETSSTGRERGPKSE